MVTPAEVISWDGMIRSFSLAMRPARQCPRCDCCTRALCEAGRQHPSGCIALTSVHDADLRARITACPCTYLDRGNDLKAEVDALNRLRAALPERTPHA